jgi:hypothetical protein
MHPFNPAISFRARRSNPSATLAISATAILLTCGSWQACSSQTRQPELKKDAAGATAPNVRAPASPSPVTSSDGKHPADTSEAISVVKLEERVSRRRLEDQPPQVRHTFGADTIWRFHLSPQISYDILSDKQSGGTHTAAVKITAVKMTLALNITYFLSAEVNENVLEHEYGHAKICRHRYAHAEEIARSCARHILGRQFEGTGKDIDSACTAATTKAAEEVGRSYDEQTNGYVTRASKIYDQLEDHGRKHERSDKNIDTAEEMAAKLK